MTRDILLLNHKIKNCGVYQYGYRLNYILKRSKTINYIYSEIENLEQYHLILIEHPYIDAIIYNYHSVTMAWLNCDTIQKNVPNIGIPHECGNPCFDFNIDIDPLRIDSYEDKMFSIPRPIYDDVEQYINEPDEELAVITDDIKDEINAFIDYSEENVPIFGSFGFGFANKGFDKFIKIINDTYDEAIIKLVIPFAHFSPYYINLQILYDQVSKPNIKLMITNNFFTNRQILKFLKSNTMNIFVYDKMTGRGISSVIDYALSVKRPLGISDSYMFRHIYSNEICLYKNDVKTCMNNSLEYCDKFTKLYSNDELCNKMEKIIDVTAPKRNIRSYSQSAQDIFVVTALQYKMNGFFLEIGANHPLNGNNTYILESKYKFKGLMVEYCDEFEQLYKQYRPNSIYEIKDATKVEYLKILTENNFPFNMDYLQIDLDVDNRSTIDTLVYLNNTIFDKYKFATVTFEHDIYRGDFFNTRELSRNIFKERGYILLFPDVRVYWNNMYQPYEDWYVHPDLVNRNFIETFKTDKSLTDNDIKNMMLNMKIC